MRNTAGFERTIARGVIDAVQFEYGRANILARQLLREPVRLLPGVRLRRGQDLSESRALPAYTLADEDFRGLNYLAAGEDRTDLIARLSS